jgi:hypothetical protein
MSHTGVRVPAAGCRLAAVPGGISDGIRGYQALLAACLVIDHAPTLVIGDAVARPWFINCVKVVCDDQ